MRSSIATMPSFLLTCLLLPATAFAQQYDIKEFAAFADEAARTKNVVNLDALQSNYGNENFSYLASESTFGAGRFGWRAGVITLPGTDKHLLVVYTPLPIRDVDQRVYNVVSNHGNLFIGQTLTPQDTFGYRISDHNMRVRFEPSAHKVHITDTITLATTRNPRPYALIRLGSEFLVEKMSSGGAPLKFEQAGGLIAFAVRGQMPAKIDIQYSGVLDRRGFNGTIGPDEAMLTGSYWWPSIARSPATMKTTVTAPKGWKVVGTGGLTSHAADSYVFELKQPTSFFALSAAPYAVTERKAGGVTYSVYQLKANAQTAKMALDVAAKALPFFERYSAYGYNRYSIVESPNAGSCLLAMPTVLTMPSVQSAYQIVTGVAHTWFGGYAPGTYLRNYWPESFCKYAASAFARSRDPSLTDAARIYPEALEISERSPLNEQGPEKGPDALKSALGKGAKALENLEDTVGAANMVRVLKNFIAAVNSATETDWELLQYSLFKTMGEQYTWFLDYWVRFPGSIKMHLDDVKYADKQVTGSLTVERLIVSLDIPVSVYSAKHQDGTDEKVKMIMLTTHFTLPTAEAPTSFAIDPHLRLYRDVPKEDLPAMIRMIEKPLVVVPDGKMMDLSALQTRLKRCLGPVAVRRESAVSMSDFDSNTVVFYGDDKYKLKDKCKVMFPSDMYASLRPNVLAPPGQCRIEVAYDANHRLVGHLNGYADFPLWPLGLAQVAWYNGDGVPDRAVDAPITEGPLAVPLTK